MSESLPKLELSQFYEKEQSIRVTRFASLQDLVLVLPM